VCGRAGDDGDVMVVRLVRLALRLLPRQVACMAASYCFCVTWRFAPPHALAASLKLCARAHALVGAVGLSCEAETCCARRRLVVRGRDLSCEGSSSGKLVEDAAIWPRTGRSA
jgi:hypothetical protein